MSASEGRVPSLFPLLLAPLEKFFLGDDRPSHPMTFTSQLTFSGVIDRSAFSKALNGAIARHPLLNAYIRPAKRGQLCWVDAKQDQAQIDWGDFDAPLKFAVGEQIRLETETGLRTWVRQGPDRARVTLQFHHACADGIGAYRFIGELLGLYTREINGAASVELEPLTPRLLRDRALCQTDLYRTGRRGAILRRVFGQLWDIVRQRPTALETGRPPLAERTPFPGLETASLPAEDYQRLRQAAQAVGCTLNDLLLAALFHALHVWTERTTGGRGKWLRLMMPADLRETAEQMMPAASLATPTFLTRRRADCQDPAALIDGIRDETLRIRANRGGVRFSDSVAIGFSVPSAMRLLLNSPICMFTGVLSNMGDPSRRLHVMLPRRQGRIVAGNLVLEEISGAPPMRPKSRATFSVVSYLRRLTIGLRCDPQYFTSADTRALLATYMESIQSFLPTPGAAPPPAQTSPNSLSALTAVE